MMQIMGFVTEKKNLAICHLKNPFMKGKKQIFATAF